MDLTDARAGVEPVGLPRPEPGAGTSTGSSPFDGPVATLAMDVREDGGLRPGYELKLNSYDLGVDIELYDADPAAALRASRGAARSS